MSLRRPSNAHSSAALLLQSQRFADERVVIAVRVNKQNAGKRAVLSNLRSRRFFCVTMKSNQVHLHKTWRLSELHRIDGNPGGDEKDFALYLDRPKQWQADTVEAKNELLWVLTQLSRRFLPAMPVILNVDDSQLKLMAETQGYESIYRLGDEPGDQDDDPDLSMSSRDASLGGDMVRADEIAEIEELLEAHDMMEGDATALTERVAEELGGNEEANIFKILEAESTGMMSELSTALEHSVERISSISDWLNGSNQHLDNMKRAIHEIMLHNKEVEVQTRNHRMLHEQLTSLLHDLHVDPRDLTCLRDPALHWTSAQGVDHLTEAVARISDVTTRDFALCREMRAVRTRVAEFKDVLASFARELSRELQARFTRQRGEIEARRRLSKKGQVSLAEHAEQHAELRPFSPLMRWMRDFDHPSFIAVHRAYYRTMAPVCRDELKASFAELRHLISRDNRRSSQSLLSSAMDVHEAPAPVSYVATAASHSPSASPDTSAGSSAVSTSAESVVRQSPGPSAGTLRVPSTPLRRFSGASDGVSQASTTLTRGGATAAISHSAATLPRESSAAAVAAAGGSSSVASLTSHGSAGNKMHVAKVFGVLLGSAHPYVVAEEEFCTSFFADTDVRRVMFELFDVLRTEMLAVADLAEKLDYFALPAMLVTAVQYQVSNASRSGFFARELAEVQKRLRTHWDKFIDDQVEKVKKLDFSPKRVGVVSVFRKLPKFLECIDTVVGEAHRHLVEQTFQTLTVVAFHWLEMNARRDSKYYHICVMENMYYYYAHVGRLHITPLANRVAQAEKLYSEHLDQYTDWVVMCQFHRMLEFFKEIEAMRVSQGIDAKEVQFKSQFNKAALRKSLAPFSGQATMEKAVLAMFRRVFKHLSQVSGLHAIVWMRIKMHFLSSYIEAEQIVHRCYENEAMSPTSEAVAQIFDAIALRHQPAGAAASTSAASPDVPTSDGASKARRNLAA